jgi:dihydroorotase
LLLSLAVKWSLDHGVNLVRALQVITSGPAGVLGASLGKRQGRIGCLKAGSAADLCIFDPADAWTVQPGSLLSQGKHTPFSSYELPGRVRYTIADGRVAYQSTGV